MMLRLSPHTRSMDCINGFVGLSVGVGQFWGFWGPGFKADSLA